MRHSITALRVSLGAVFLGFGVLKYVPGLSPAQNIVSTTMELLTFELVPGGVALVLVATLECVIGLSLLTRVGLRAVIYLLGVELLGVLSPLVLVTGRLFSGPFHAPTLEGHYVLKDITLVAAAMVVVAANFRGARIAYKSPLPWAGHLDDAGSFTPEEKLAIVLAGLHGDYSIAQLCTRHGITLSDYEYWRHDAVDSATNALTVES